MTLFRPHRGSLDAAMNEVREFNNFDEFLTWLTGYFSEWMVEVRADKLLIEPYGYDDRIDWDTYIVTLEGYGVVGFTNGPLEK